MFFFYLGNIELKNASAINKKVGNIGYFLLGNISCIRPAGGIKKFGSVGDLILYSGTIEVNPASGWNIKGWYLEVF